MAALYTQLLGGQYDTPVVPEGYYSSWAQYTIKAKSPEHRAKVQAALKAADIPSMVYYPKPLHMQTVYESLGYQAGDLPVSERLSSVVFSLPMHGYLTEDIVRKVCDVLRQVED